MPQLPAEKRQGNFDEVEVPKDKLLVAEDLCAHLCFIFNIDPQDIYGHSEFEPMKTCPGRKVNMNQFRNDVEAVIAEVYEGIV